MAGGIDVLILVLLVLSTANTAGKISVVRTSFAAGGSEI